MKSNIKHYIFTASAVAAVALLSPLCSSAQKFSLKPHVDIGVGNAMSLDSDISDLSKSASNMDFGLDFGYTFWQLGGNRLEANIGVGYSATNLKLTAPSMSYSYDAPASADEDGNTYVRHYQLSDMEQKVSLGYFTVPVYLTYGYRINKTVGVHADLGFKLGFKCGSSLKSVSGTASSYGVYPQYDNLMIDAPWLNGFGTTSLGDAARGDVSASGVYASLLVGAAVDVRIYGPLWFNAGIRYNCGFTNSFKQEYKGNAFTAETAPVTYTVAGGQEVKPLTGYLSSSKLSPFSIHLGFDVRF